MIVDWAPPSPGPAAHLCRPAFFHRHTPPYPTARALMPYPQLPWFRLRFHGRQRRAPSGRQLPVRRAPPTTPPYYPYGPLVPRSTTAPQPT